MPNSSSDFKLFATAILAALLDPDAMRSKNRRKAIRKAADLLERLPTRAVEIRPRSTLT